MRAIVTKLSLVGAAALCLLFAGCLVSATFVLVDDFEFTAQSGFYFYQVDITDEPDWQDHKDQIDMVDAVGAEFYITSTESGPVTFSAFIDDYSGTGSNPTSVPGTASAIIEDLTINPGQTHITYVQSLGIIKNTARLKALAKTGKFDYYGTSTGNLGTSFRVDSAKVIVTVSASS